MKHDVTRRAFLFGRTLANNKSGATAVEYGLIGALISVATIVGITRLSGRTKAKYTCTTRAVKGQALSNGCKANGFKN
ncbi:MAG: Flp family type IVb pilin [Ahrensia sp.]|nr:Flp family type IVb pilin [Ahrensia sp.]